MIIYGILAGRDEIEQNRFFRQQELNLYKENVEC